MAQSESKPRTVISDGADPNVQADPQSGPRYLYYLLFTEDIGLPLQNPAFSGNSYLGRVKADSVAPPRTVLLIKRRLCNIEGISDYPGSILFLSRSSQSPMDDGERVSILTPGGVGSTPEKPMELVVKESGNNADRLSKHPIGPEPQYLYYRLYTEDGEAEAKNPINPEGDDCTSLARINYNLVPPPHTLNSTIRCISHVEGFLYCGWHQLFLDSTSESAMTDRDVLTLESGSPGSLPERPHMFVRSAGMTRRLIPGYTADRSSMGLLPVGIGMYTDGVVRREILPNESNYSDVYRARDAAGKHGLVLKSDVREIK